MGQLSLKTFFKSTVPERSLAPRCLSSIQQSGATRGPELHSAVFLQPPPEAKPFLWQWRTVMRQRLAKAIGSSGFAARREKAKATTVWAQGGRGREACKPGRHWVQADDFLIFRINDSNGDPFSSPCNFSKTTDVLYLDRYDRVKSQEVKGGQWVGGERGAGGGKGGVPRKRRLGSFRPSEV